MRITESGNIGIGTETVSNLGGWQRVMEINANNYSKSLVSCVNNGVNSWFLMLMNHGVVIMVLVQLVLNQTIHYD